MASNTSTPLVYTTDRTAAPCTPSIYPTIPGPVGPRVPALKALPPSHKQTGSSPGNIECNSSPNSQTMSQNGRGRICCQELSYVVTNIITFRSTPKVSDVPKQHRTHLSNVL